MNTQTQVSESYWVGPAGVLIPNDIECVTAIDGCNNICKNGGGTHNWVPIEHRYTEKSYREKYAECREGVYYWKDILQLSPHLFCCPQP